MILWCSMQLVHSILTTLWWGFGHTFSEWTDQTSYHIQNDTEWDANSSMLEQHCRESWIPSAPHLALLQIIYHLVMTSWAWGIKVNNLQTDRGSSCYSVNFSWPICTSISNASLVWPVLTSWSRRDFCLYCYPPSHQNSFPMIPTRYTVPIVQTCPHDNNGLADII